MPFVVVANALMRLRLVGPDTRQRCFPGAKRRSAENRNTADAGETNLQTVEIGIKRQHRAWVLDPIAYVSVEELVRGLDENIIKPALVRLDELVVKKTEKLRFRRIEK